MDQYIRLLREIKNRGVMKEQRAVLAGGSRLRALSVFGMQARFDLAAGFPLVTTKRVGFSWVVRELLWFLSGSTNNNDLKAQGVTIWNEWADDATGDLGPIYGQQWRRWVAPGGHRIDQVARLVEDIRTVAGNPQASVGRRLILTAWNPADIPPPKAPPPCHTLSQFDVTKGRLSCQLYQRSADMFLGVPFNIASYALLTHLLAKVTGLGVGDFVHTFGDAHIYENHLEQVDEQIFRATKPLPRLELDPSICSIDEIKEDQIRLIGYDSHPPIRGEVAI